MKTKPNLETIVGPDVFARLQKNGINNFTDVKRISPENLMTIAGVGPQKAFELYHAAGKKISQGDIEKIYNSLRFRTALRNVKQGLRSLTTDPKPVITKVETVREHATAWENLANSLYNIGRNTGERKSTRVYVPVTQVLDPYAMATQQKTADNLYAEVFITKEPNRIKIQYDAKDLSDQARLTTSTEFITSKESGEIATQLRDTLREIYDRFRERTLIGQFIVVFDRQLYDYYWDIKDQFKREVQEMKDSLRPGYEIDMPAGMILVPSISEYYNWEAIFKYNGYRPFESMVARFNRYLTYFEYDKYLSENQNSTDVLPYEEWLAQFPDPDFNFWKVITSRKLSHYALSHQDYVVEFGILKGMPGLDSYESYFKPVPLRLEFYRDTGFQSYLSAKRDFVPTAKIPAVVAALVHATLDDFTIEQKGLEYIFKSNAMPEIGMHYIPR